MSADQILYAFYPLTSGLVASTHSMMRPFIERDALDLMFEGLNDSQVYRSLADALDSFEG